MAISRKKIPPQPYRNFDAFLDANGLREEVERGVTRRLEAEGLGAEAELAREKRFIALQIEKERKARKLTKSKLAEMVGTSRAQLDRVLDPYSQNITIDTLRRVAAAMGKRLHIELIDE